MSLSKIEIITNMSKLTKLKKALSDAGVTGMTVIQVLGCGIECEIKEVGSFIYRSVYENGMTEYELDHVFTGCYDGDYHPDLNEIEELKYVDIDYLLKDIKDNPDRYTSWFKTALYMAIKALQL